LKKWYLFSRGGFSYLQVNAVMLNVTLTSGRNGQPAVVQSPEREKSTKWWMRCWDSLVMDF